MFQLNGYSNPFPRSEEVVQDLQRRRMIQAPAPLPWREEELKFLRDGLGLKGQGLI